MIWSLYVIKCIISTTQRIHVKATQIWEICNNLFQNMKRAIQRTLVRLLKYYIYSRLKICYALKLAPCQGIILWYSGFLGYILIKDLWQNLHCLIQYCSLHMNKPLPNSYWQDLRLPDTDRERQLSYDMTYMQNL